MPCQEQPGSLTIEGRGLMVNSMADEAQDDPASDLYGRVIALEAIVTRLLASHAQITRTA